MQNYYTHKYFLYFYPIFINFILYVYFIVHIVTVFFRMQINEHAALQIQTAVTAHL